MPLLVTESGRRIFRIELDRFIAVAQCLIGLAFVDMGRATVSVGNRIFRIELDCLITVAQSFIGLRIVDIGSATVAVQDCKTMRVVPA